tara:strand:+ start:486 stop:752 length:267 start_codon:yes stop_codon:yes gene_type:complete
MEILILLLPMLLPLLSDCGEKDGREVLANRLRKRPGLIRHSVFLKAKENGSSRKEARQIANNAVRELANSSEEEIYELVDDAMSDVNE